MSGLFGGNSTGAGGAINSTSGIQGDGTPTNPIKEHFEALPQDSAPLLPTNRNLRIVLAASQANPAGSTASLKAVAGAMVDAGFLSATGPQGPAGPRGLTGPAGAPGGAINEHIVDIGMLSFGAGVYTGGQSIPIAASVWKPKGLLFSCMFDRPPVAGNSVKITFSDPAGDFYNDQYQLRFNADLFNEYGDPIKSGDLIAMKRYLFIVDGDPLTGNDIYFLNTEKFIENVVLVNRIVGTVPRADFGQFKSITMPSPAISPINNNYNRFGLWRENPDLSASFQFTVKGRYEINYVLQADFAALSGQNVQCQLTGALFNNTVASNTGFIESQGPTQTTVVNASTVVPTSAFLSTANTYGNPPILSTNRK